MLLGLALSPGAHAQPQPPAAPAEAPALVPPKLISDAVVAYPEGATGEATVVLTLVVDETGAVRSATAVEPNEPFSSEAEVAALSWRFEPATRDGQPITARIRFEVIFRPPEPAPEQEPAAPSTAPQPDVAGRPISEPQPPKPDEPLDVTVTGQRPEPGRTASLTRAEVRELPGAFGDPLRAIEALPGVTPIVSGLPFFFIRGAPPGNVGYFLDGIRVPLLFHVGAGPSIIHPGLVDRVDLYPGGYPARFGRYAGGIVSTETLPPEKELHGEYNLRLFDAGVLVEAPFAEKKATVLVGGRYSYTAAVLTLLSPETVLQYWDYQARASYDLSRSDTLSVFAFGSYDYLGEKTQTGTVTLFGMEFHRVDLRYDHNLEGRGTMRSAFTLGIDRSRAPQDRSVRARLAATRTELLYRLSEGALLRAGTDLQLDYYDVELGPIGLSPVARRAAEFFPTRTDIAVGTRADVVITVGPSLDVTPGVRVDLFGSQGASALAVDPRLATRARASKNVHVLTTFGVAHQPPAFVVPVPGVQPGGLRGGLQRALQESLGVEVDLGDATTATATVFHNAFFNMSDPLSVTEPELEGCPPGSFPDDSLAGDPGGQPDEARRCGDERFEPGTLGPDRSGGGGQAADSIGGRRALRAFEVRTLGSAYGLELFLKRRLTSKLGGFLSYTLSRSTRSNGRRRHIASFDRTHVANAAVAYNLGRNWRVGARGVFYTGLPKAPDPTDPDSTRLPPFYRLDLRLEKRWNLSQDVWIAFVAEGMNVTLNKEAISTSCTLSGCEAETIGPVSLPSVGVEGGF